MKVLLVDDDAGQRETLADLLRRGGHEVAEAGDGLQAYELFRENDFDVVLTDWLMPRMDGPSLCRAIRGLARETYTGVIVMTALGGNERLIEALDAGADDFLVKPVDRSVLAARMRVAQRRRDLHERITRLEGLLSVCAYCKRIRRDDGSWVPFEGYLEQRSDLRFSHGICPTCLDERYPSLARDERRPGDRSAPER